VENKSDVQVRRFVKMFALPNQLGRARRETIRAIRSPYQQRGTCDFCAAGEVLVRIEYQTEGVGWSFRAHLQGV